jgi:uncharacterized membrane protein YccC
VSREIHLTRGAARVAVLECGVLAVACLLAFWLTTYLLTGVQVASVSRDDDLLGGMWAVLATVFVFRDSYEHSIAAAVSRISATAVSFVICLVYLIFLPFYPWAMAGLIGVSVLAVTLLGRPGDGVTAGITTAVVMVLAAISPEDAWHQPILRFADTVVGVVVGVAAAWAGLRVIRPRARQGAHPSRAPGD